MENRTKKMLLLVLNSVLLTIGTCGGPLIVRLYFIHGGKRIWVSSLIQNGGWPLILLPLIAAYINRRITDGPAAKRVLMRPFLFYASTILGCLIGLDSYLYGYGASKLPVSTSTLIVATQLAFTAAFAFLLVKQSFTPYSINAVFLLIVGPALLSLRASSDRPEGESNKDYVIGFVIMLAAVALYGFIMPAVELAYARATQDINYTLVLEMQAVMSFFATAFSLIGMFVHKDFQGMAREGREFGLGEAKYYLILVFSCLIFQCCFLGAIGVIFCSSSLFSGIIISLMLPATEILAVLFYHENFQAEKIVALVLSLWAFVSYFFGERKHGRGPGENLNLKVARECN